MQVSHQEVNLNSTSKIKKIVILKFLAPTAIHINTSLARPKNVFLDSPFHFKTPKTHLSVPTLKYSLTLPYTTLQGLKLVGVTSKVITSFKYQLKI